MQSKILIAEDNEKNLYLVRFILQKAGYDVIEARDGEEALRKISSEAPDVILMDLQLPKLQGMEVIRRVKADADLAPIPIIAVTAYAMRGDRERTLAAGCADYIPKPIDPQALLASIHKALQANEKESEV